VKRVERAPELTGAVLSQLADAMAQHKLPSKEVVELLTQYSKKAYPTAPARVLTSFSSGKPA